MRQNQDSLPGDGAIISCYGKESNNRGCPDPPLNHELEALVAFQPVGRHNCFSQAASDVSHQSIPTTTILSSTIDEELRSPSHCSVDHCLPSDLPCSSPHSTSAPHFSDPQPDQKPDSNAHNGCPLQHPSSDPTLNHPSACDPQLVHFPDRSDRHVGVKSISCSDFGSVLLTYSAEVYAWGMCGDDQVLPDRPTIVKQPVKLPINNIISISADLDHCFALSSDDLLYCWSNHAVNLLSEITLINSPYFFKEICSSKNSSKSFGLTVEGKLIQFGNGTFKPMQGINMHKIVFISAYLDSIVAVDSDAHFFFLTNDGSDCTQYISFVEIPVGKYILPTKLSLSSFLFDYNFLLVIDSNGDVWRFDKEDDDSFDNKPRKVLGLSNIVSINGNDDIYAAIDSNGKVFVWGRLSRFKNISVDIESPICIEVFTNIECVSLGHDFLFAYNKNTVWAWGRNDKGQLGTGDLIDRLQPVKVFGSEILGTFHHPNQPLDSMFSGLIKLIYFEYLQYLKKLFGNHPYTKARYYTKCSISKKVAKFSKEVINGFDFLKNPQHLNLNDYVWDLQLQLSFAFNDYSVTNTRLKTLDIYYDTDEFDPQFLSFFPAVEVVKLGAKSRHNRRLSLNLTHLSNLKFLELNCSFIIEQLPPSLVKLVLKDDFEVTDLSYLTALKELVLFGGPFISERVLKAQIPLPLSIARLEVWLRDPVNIEIEIPSIKELIIHEAIHTNITEQNFPSLKFIQLLGPLRNLSSSSLSPTKLDNQGLIQSTKLIKNEYLVELSCFPWCFKYSYCSIFALARALERNSTLTTLDLQSNNIANDGANALARALERNSTLTTLDLQSNNIANDGASALARALGSNSTLTTLDLQSNNIANDGASALARALERNSTLTTLDLQSNNIANDGASALARALESNSTLTTLDLQSNNIANDGASALARALESNSTLTTLDLQSNNIANDGANALARALGSNSTLTTLDLQSNNIANDGASALARALERNSTLTTLDLQSNNIANDGASALARALESNSTLTTLDLQSNNIANEGASALARALERNSTLTTLDLQSNNIANDGASALARALESNSTLTTLDLAENNITDEGASALARALESNFSLTQLNLWGNNIADEGASALARALESNFTLTELDLGINVVRANNIANEGASALARALESNFSLAQLNLWGNNIADEGASALARALESNFTLTTLDLYGNNISNSTKSKLRQIASNRPSLTIFL
ncbi:hypothetical protein P9112_011021 [Eukaryota sp. TZLM1-RC]